MKTFFLCLFMLMTLGGCSTNFSETKQVNDTAYIQLMGSTSNLSLILDGQSVNVRQMESFWLDGKRATKFQTTVGTHQIKIFRRNNLIINRQIFVSSGNTFEVQLP
jgi:hypothetical protein